MNGQPDTKFEKTATAIARSTGTAWSLIIHSIVFAAIMALYFAGVAVNTVLLILTTLLSVEAIYLQIFTQIISNKICDAQEEAAES